MIAVYRRLSSFVFFISYFDMYTLQYWHEHAMEWRGAGFRSDDRDAVVRRMRGAAEQCDYCVRFRVARD